jgi:hypothetical protein
MSTENLPDRQTRYEVPKLEDIYEEKNIPQLGKFNEFNKVLNAPPRASWIRQHPTAKKEIRDPQSGQMKKVPVEFIPIGIVEYLLTTLFIKWRPEVLEVGILANSVFVTVRVHVLNPLTMEWEWYDGVGAVPIRVNKDQNPTDFTQMQSGAIQTGLPAAKSYAISDACDCIGKIFGKDLNRNAEMDYQPMQEAKGNALAILPDELIAEIAISDLEQLKTIFLDYPEFQGHTKFNMLLNERREALKRGGENAGSN